MMPSLTSRISSKRSTADGFSIFDSKAARPLASSRASVTSSGRCTKDSASQSTPNSQTNSRSARSFSDRAANGSTTSGTFTPLRFEITPPMITSQLAKSAPHSMTLRRILPSLTNRLAPGFSAAKISGWGRQTREASPSSGSRSRRKAAPTTNCSLSPENTPTRSFGPCRSARMPMVLFRLLSTSRMIRCFSRISAWLP